MWTGASTAPELDGALAAADGIELRLPYQSDPVSRAKINAGTMEYIDVHLSHVAQMVWEGFLGHLDVALVEVSGITADGELIPSSSVGNNKTWIDLADAVILEVNAWQTDGARGHARHLLRHRPAAGPASHPADPGPATGSACRTSAARRRRSSPSSRPTPPTATPPSSRPTRTPRRIAGHIIEFLEHEVRAAGCPRRCCRCSRGWATSPTPCSPGWRRPFGTSPPTPR